MSNDKFSSGDSVITIELDSSIVSSLYDLSIICHTPFSDFCRTVFIRGLLSFISSRLKL